MEEKKKLIKKIKKEAKRNNIDSISRNHSSFINTFSSSNRTKHRKKEEKYDGKKKKIN